VRTGRGGGLPPARRSWTSSLTRWRTGGRWCRLAYSRSRAVEDSRSRAVAIAVAACGGCRLASQSCSPHESRLMTKEAALAALGAGGLGFGGMGRWDANLGQCWARPAGQEWNHRCLQSSGTTGSSGTGTHYPNYPIKLRVIRFTTRISIG
jgi:hypothetical protein